MNSEYILSSLPALSFGEKAPLSRERFRSIIGGEEVERSLLGEKWRKLETELRNAMAEARGGAEHKRPGAACSLYWRGRLLACFRETDVIRRDELIDRVWWDAAGELTDLASPLGRGALATYLIRLNIVLKRSLISKAEGEEAFDRLTQATKKVI